MSFPDIVSHPPPTYLTPPPPPPPDKMERCRRGLGGGGVEINIIYEWVYGPNIIYERT